MRWTPFKFQGKVYDLNHLYPMRVKYLQPAKGAKPEHEYQVDIIFSSHCFTRGYAPGESASPELLFSHDGETRVFDLTRHALSFHLPAIVEGLPARKCYHTEFGNFFVLELVTGVTSIEYEVFFKAYKATRRGPVTRTVQSAYVRDKDHKKDKPRGKPIGFHVILFNTLNNKPIKPPQ